MAKVLPMMIGYNSELLLLLLYFLVYYLLKESEVGDEND